jgi:hypothetical protein
VVVLVIGIAMALTVFTVQGGGGERSAREEVRRVERLVQVVSGEALLRVAEYGIEFTRAGYRFLRWDGAEWQSLPDPGVLRDHRWPDAFAVSLEVEGRPIPLGDAFAVEEPIPQVVFLSSGEVSPFLLAIVVPESRRGERLRVHLSARTERAPVEGTP